MGSEADSIIGGPSSGDLSLEVGADQCPTIELKTVIRSPDLYLCLWDRLQVLPRFDSVQLGVRLGSNLRTKCLLHSDYLVFK